MSGDPFDDAIEDRAADQAQDPIDAAIDRMTSTLELRARRATMASADQDPEQAAEARRLSLKFGTPPAVVGRNLDAFHKREQADKPWGQIQQETPAVAAFMGDPADAAIAKDDMEQLGLLEWLVTAPSRAKRQGDAQVELSTLRHQNLFRDLSPAEQARVTALKEEQKKGGELGAGAGWFRGAVVGSAREVPILWGGSLAALEKGIPAAVAAGTTAAILGQLGPQAGLPEELVSVPIMFGAGLRAGGAVGGAEYGFRVESGLAYDEFLDIKDERGQPMDPDVAKAAALAAGAINGGLEALGLGVLLKTFPGAKMLTGALTRNAVKQALKNTTVRAALGTAVKEYAGTLTAETAMEVAQRAVTILAGELGKTASGQAIPHRSPTDVASELWQEGVGAFQSMALLSAPGPLMSGAIDVRRARRAEQNVAFFTALGEGVANSKTAQRAPDRLQAFLSQATKDGPVENIYVPTEAWRGWFQTQGLDPETVARELTGNSDALREAIDQGRDLQIPTAAYAAKLAGTPHNAGLMQDIRLGPDEWNAREVDAFKAEQEAVAAEQQAATETAPTGAAAAQKVMYDRMLAVGIPERTAQTWSRFFSAGVGRMAEDFGLPADVLQGAYGPGGGPTVSREGYVPVRTDAVATAGAAPSVQPETPAGATAPAIASLIEAQPGEPIGEAPPGGGVAGPGPDTLPPRTITGTETPAATGPTSTFDPDQPIAAMGNIGAAALRMMSENPDIVRAANAMRQRAMETGRANEPAGPGPAAGQPTEADRRQLAADVAGAVEGGGDGSRAERQRLPSPIDYAGEGIFQRQSAEADQVRLTPEVTREVERIAEELAEFPFTARTWAWLGSGEAKTGTAAGGEADIIAGGAGAPVYNDVLQFAPLNKGKGGEAAKMVGGSRADVERAARKILSGGAIHNNLAEGIMRVAERRAVSDYRHITPPMLPPAWGIEASPELIQDLSAGIDAAIAPADLLAETPLTDEEIAGLDVRATSFDVTEFEQGLFDDVQDEQQQPAGVDVLTTGEKQPRLPGDVGDVREQEVATPQIEAPFSLTSEVSKGKKGKQTSLFQQTRGPLGPKNAQGVAAYFIGWQMGDPPDIPHFALYNVVGGPRNGSTLDQTELEAEGIVVPDTPPQPTTFYQSVWHGSPHIFDRFSLHAIGSGEGAQVYGWGLYFASLKEVAQGYRDRLTNDRQPKGLAVGGQRIFEPGGAYQELRNAMTLSGADADPDTVALAQGLSELHARAYFKPAGPNALKQIRAELEVSIANYKEAIAKNRPISGDVTVDGYRLAEAESALFALDAYPNLELVAEEQSGRLYKVEIPDDDVMLDYDKPASQQSPNVQAALAKMGITWKPNTYPTLVEATVLLNEQMKDENSYFLWSTREFLAEGLALARQGDERAFEAWYDEHGELIGADPLADPTGRDIYQKMIANIEREEGWAKVGSSAFRDHAARLASIRLNEAGVLGIRYLDQGSRAEGAGTANYVVFDDNLVQITEYEQRSQPLTRALVDAFVEDVLQRFGADLPMFSVHLTQQGDLHLAGIAVDRGAQRAGVGTRVMEELTRFADYNNVRVTLSPAQRDPAWGTTSRNRLVNFYKRFGFVENKGRASDQSLSAGMYREPTMRAQRQALEQGGQRKGAIRFGPDRQFDIALFERADLSTFLHETGHFFLEVMGDLVDELATRDAETLTPGQRRLQANYAAALTFLGVENRGQIAVEQHELFARAFEAYLMEGKAPSLELREVFARARAWLVGIYRSLRGLNVQLSPEIRQVFDRILASDAEIARAEQEGRVDGMFLTAEAAGMDPARFDLYRSAIERASQTARETLDRKLMAEVQREQEAAYKAQRAEIETEVEANVYAMPVYQALAAMQRGTNADGSALVEGMETEPLRLSKSILIDRFGADRLKRLPPLVYSRDGGLDPDVVAQRFGFTSGDELLTAITQAEPMRAAIKRETDARMLQEHGSMLLDGTVHEAARAAVANEDRDIIIRQELRALAQLKRTAAPFEHAGRQQVGQERRERDYERRWFEAEARLRIAIAEGHKQVEIDELTAEVQNLRQKARGGAATIRAAIPPAAMIRDAAKNRIARMRIRDIKPAVYWAASRQNAQKAIAAAARQDFDGAILAKQQELLNLQLYREAQRALDDVQTRVKFARDLSKPSSRARMGLAGDAYTDQVDGILDRYEFARVSAKVLARRANVNAFVAGLEGEGLPVNLPAEVLNDARRINYQEITVEELVGITDGLKQIVHLARLKLRLLRAQETRQLDQLAATIADSIRDLARRPRRDVERDRRPSEERRRMVEDWFAGHRKLAFLLRELDGFQDGGPLWDAIMRPLNEAGAREAEMTADATQRFAVLVDRAFPGREKRRLYTKVRIDAIGKSMSRMERIAVALNWGNEGNRDRIRRSENWNDQQVRAILDTLTVSDMQFVQGVFDFLGSYWPDIAAKMERVNGVAAERVAAVPIVCAAGEFPGGYYPLDYDDRLDAKAIGNLDLESANLARAASFAHATTKRGHEEARVKTLKRKVRFDFGPMFQHVDQVIHDLTHHEALIDIGRILGHADVQRAILETKGDIVYKQIRGTIRDVAFGDLPARSGFERGINHLRMGVTVAMLGWNFATSLLQPMGLFNATVQIGPKAMGKGLKLLLRDPRQIGNIIEEINRKSLTMRSRSRTNQREINEIRNSFGVNTGKLSGWIDDALKTTTFDVVTKQGIADSYFWAIQQMQRVADTPTWLGVYQTAMDANETEERAIALADQAVLDSQGGGQTKDLAEVQRGGPMMKLWTNFYSYFNVVYNQTVESTKRTNFKHPAEVGRLACDYLFLMIVPAVAGKVITDALRPGDDDDDASDYAWTVAGYLSGMMLGTREVAGIAAGYYGYEGPAGARAFSALARFGQQARQMELDEAFVRSLNELGGIVFHYPAAQAWRTITGIAALDEGRTENPAAIVAGPPRR